MPTSDSLLPSGPLERVAVALDTADWREFEHWCALFGPRVGVLKIGLEAYVRWGERAVEVAQRHGSRLFLDLKLHDIPNTVAGAVGSARALGVDYLTLHASGGVRMMAAAVAAAGDLKVLAVTVLTHLEPEALLELGVEGSPRQVAARWARLAADAGVAGIVCSPLELERLRPAHPQPFLLVTPGIRSVGDDAGDQRRTATPSHALASGADLLVIGRPLTRADQPDAALDRLAAELSEGDR